MKHGETRQKIKREQKKVQKKNWSRWDKTPKNVFHKNSLLIIILNSCRGLGFIEHLSSHETFLAITATSKKEKKKGVQKQIPHFFSFSLLSFFFTSSHIWPWCTLLRRYLNFSDSGRSEWEKARDGKKKKKPEQGGRERERIGMKESQTKQANQRVGAPRSPGWLMKRPSVREKPKVKWRGIKTEL